MLAFFQRFSDAFLLCFQVVGHIGTFAGRSSLSYISIDKVWPLNLLIAAITVCFSLEAIYMTVPIIWVIFLFVFLVGFIGGCTILSVFYRVTNETPAHYQVFSVCSVSIGLSAGISFAAFLSIPIHNMICKLPSPL